MVDWLHRPQWRSRDFIIALPGEHQYATHPERGNPGPPSPAKATSKAPDEKVGLGRHVKLNPMLNQASRKNSRTSSRKPCNWFSDRGSSLDPVVKCASTCLCRPVRRRREVTTFSQTPQNVGSLGGVPYCSANQATTVFNSVVSMVALESFRWQARWPCIQCRSKWHFLDKKVYEYPSQMLPPTC